MWLWHSPDVEKLVRQYPVYDVQTQSYQFEVTRPKNWVDLKDVSRHAKFAILISEDWAFYGHQGIDLYQLRLVIGESIKQGEWIRGASTITQQVIKNTVLSHERTVWRKVREMILAYKLERHVSKERILEIYLNIIELGHNLYGIKPASWHYFNKAPSQLTAREGAFLAMLLPSPVKYSLSFKKKELTPFAREIIETVLIKMRQAKIFDEDQRKLEAKKYFYWESVTDNSDGEDIHRPQ
jgi:monofunctional glycosyltransferase